MKSIYCYPKYTNVQEVAMSMVTTTMLPGKAIYHLITLLHFGVPWAALVLLFKNKNRWI